MEGCKNIVAGALKSLDKEAAFYHYDIRVELTLESLSENFLHVMPGIVFTPLSLKLLCISNKRIILHIL